MQKTLWWVLVLLLVCVIAFSACDKDNQQQTPSETTDATTETETEAHVHAFGEWSVVKEATCTAPGEQERICACGEKEIQILNAAAHTEEIIPAVAPTCTTAGTTEGKKCSVCGVVLTAPETVQPAAHTEESIPAVAPTCTTAGTTEGKKCSVCGVVLAVPETVQPVAHTEEIIPAVAPTCTTAGTTEGRYCTICEDDLVTPKQVQMKQHCYDVGYCIYCNEHEPTATLVFEWFSKDEAEYEGYYVMGIEDDSNVEVLYIPSSHYTEEYGVLNVVGIHQSAFEDNQTISTVYFPYSMKIVEESAFRGGCQRVFNLNHGLEVLEYDSLGYIKGDLIIPQSIRVLGAKVATNQYGSYIYYSDNDFAPRLIFHGDYPKIVDEQAFYGFIVIYNPNMNGWPGGNGITKNSGVLYRSDFDPDSLYEDDMFIQMNIGNELVYKTAQSVYQNFGEIDWTLLRITNTEEKYQYFYSLANEITKDCVTNKEKINAIFDWVRTNICYNANAMYMDVYDSAIQKEGVCAQYTGIMTQLLRCLNIPSLQVEGFLWWAVPISTKWVDENYANMGDERHAWVVAYDGESWMTYDPTNGFVFDKFDSEYCTLFPTHVESIHICGEGYYPYAFIGEILCVNNGYWYEKSDLGYVVPILGYGDNFKYYTSQLNQINGNSVVYLIRYNQEGELTTGVYYWWSIYEQDKILHRYSYVLPNGRVLVNISVNISGTEYYFDEEGICTTTVPPEQLVGKCLQ